MTEHTPHDPLAVIHRQIADTLTQIGTLKASLEALDTQQKDTRQTLSAVRETLDSVSRTLAQQAEVLETIPGLASTVAELGSLLPPALKENTYEPAGTRRWWWELDPGSKEASGTPQERQQARDEAIADLREWVDTIYRPYFGWLSEPLGECWDKHLMALVIIDALCEMWSYLYLSAPRTPALLSRQMEFQVRAVKELAEQLARECPRNCEAHR